MSTLLEQKLENLGQLSFHDKIVTLKTLLRENHKNYAALQIEFNKLTSKVATAPTVAYLIKGGSSLQTTDTLTQDESLVEDAIERGLEVIELIQREEA